MAKTRNDKMYVVYNNSGFVSAPRLDVPKYASNRVRLLVWLPWANIKNIVLPTFEHMFALLPKLRSGFGRSV